MRAQSALRTAVISTILLLVAACSATEPPALTPPSIGPDVSGSEACPPGNGAGREDLPGVATGMENQGPSGFETLHRWQPCIQGPVTALVLVDARDGRYALAAAGDQVHLVEIGDVGGFRFLATVFTAPGPVTQLQVSGALLGALVDGEDGGLLLYDIGSLDAPVLRGRHAGSFESLELAGDHAYLAAGDEGLYVVDISDPATPEQAAHVPPWTGDQDRPGMTRTASVKDVRVVDGLAYVAAFGAGMAVFDVSRPGSPERLGGFPTPGLATRVAVGDDHIFVANNIVTPFTIWVVDASDPASPEAVGRYDDQAVNGRVTHLAAVGQRLHFMVSSATMVGPSWMLATLDVSRPDDPSMLGRYWRSSYAGQMHVRDGTAYVADSHGVAALDLRPDEPTPIGRLVAGAGPTALHVEEPFAYLFTQAGLHILERTGEGLEERARYDLDGRTPSSFSRTPSRFEDRMAYFVVDRHQEQPLDLSDPLEPRWLDPVPRELSPYEYSFVISGQADTRHGLRVYEREGDQTHQISEIFLGSGSARGAIAQEGRHIYVVAGRTLYVLDASDPQAPVVVAEEQLRGLPAGDTGWPTVSLHAGRAYVLSDGLWVYDVTQPEAPVLLAAHATAATAVAASDGRVYVAGPRAELEVLQP